MSLEPGTTLGSYTITAHIGEGGMGEVYRARDTKLARDVALKVLPESFTSDHDRVARFEREAKLLASLNHPNIGGIYGLEESDPSSQGYDGQAAVKALVLELVEGPTLADRIAEGPIPVDEAMALGAFPISRSRAHTHRRHGHPLQTVPSAGLIERPPEKNRVDALR